MPPHVSADRPAAQSPECGAVDALISRTRVLRGEVDAVRRGAGRGEGDAHGRWQQALCELAMQQLDDLDSHLAQLQAGPPPATTAPSAAFPRATEPPAGSLLRRVGSAEWNLLNDEVTWSGELYQIVGRDPGTPPPTLDELPSLVLAEDQPALTAMVTGCLIDGRPIDGEFRVARSDGTVRTVHMLGEPVLDSDGGTASMWAVLRDVSELRRSRRAVGPVHDFVRNQRGRAHGEGRLAAEVRETVLPRWRGPLRFPRGGPDALSLAAHHLPAPDGADGGGHWYDAVELPAGETLLSVGELTGQGVAVVSGMATVLGAVRGMAVAGARPGDLVGWLNQLLDASPQPALGSAVCCRYNPATRVLSWAQAGHPAPLLFRDGTGRALARPRGVLLGATSTATYTQDEEHVDPGDLLVLYTEGLAPRSGALPTPDRAPARLLGLAPRFAEAGDAQECVRAVVEEFGSSGRTEGACVLVAMIGS
ncbi:PP2C family protein-serine/threonine phosphatase [Streptomyces tsukubensis]|uniref:Phosphatase n=1 Tax=Streptomyces tsukubensis TaxID=83656 RepID=A0A1V4A7Q6_9ACTN|nr:SpoIIE family protein phosphatase [Streptomyces tsukubensis]OON77986.1 phosphatase [Streptomyces tsukubensis]QFR97150.1 SpoIIE family protein phosphatase [Streptomyces tsukubensis]